MIPAILIALLVGVLVFVVALQGEKKKRKRTASEEYIAELRKAKGLREANKQLGGGRG